MPTPTPRIVLSTIVNSPPPAARRSSIPPQARAGLARQAERQADRERDGSHHQADDQPGQRVRDDARAQQASPGRRDQQRRGERAVAVLGARADDPKSSSNAEIVLPTASAERLSGIVFGFPASTVISTIASVASATPAAIPTPCGWSAA